MLDAGERYGYRGKKGAEALVGELTGLFSGGELAEEDMRTISALEGCGWSNLDPDNLIY